jgi:hypothetical protein
MKKNNKNRKSGAWKGKLIIAIDFDILPSNFIKYFKELPVKSE